LLRVLLSQPCRSLPQRPDQPGMLQLEGPRAPTLLGTSDALGLPAGIFRQRAKTQRTTKPMSNARRRSRRSVPDRRGPGGIAPVSDSRAKKFISRRAEAASVRGLFHIRAEPATLPFGSASLAISRRFWAVAASVNSLTTSPQLAYRWGDNPVEADWPASKASPRDQRPKPRQRAERR
jgi:hypothetical protein